MDTPCGVSIDERNHDQECSRQQIKRERYIVDRSDEMLRGDEMFDLICDQWSGEETRDPTGIVSILTSMARSRAANINQAILIERLNGWLQQVAIDAAEREVANNPMLAEEI